MYCCVTKPNVSISEASTRTLSDRCKAVETMRFTIGGGGGGDSALLQAAELKRLSREGQKNVLQLAGIQSETPPPELSMKLKSESGLNMNQWRTLQE